MIINNPAAQLTSFLEAFQGTSILDRTLTGIDTKPPSFQATEQPAAPQIEVNITGGSSHTFTNIQHKFWMSGTKGGDVTNRLKLPTHADNSSDLISETSTSTQAKLTGQRGLNILLEASPDGVYQTLLRHPDITTICYTHLSRFDDSVIQNAISFLESRGYIVKFKTDNSNQKYLEITRPQSKPTFSQLLAFHLDVEKCTNTILVHCKKQTSCRDLRFAVDHYPYPVIAEVIKELRGPNHELDAAFEFRINGLDRYDTIVIHRK